MVSGRSDLGGKICTASVHRDLGFWSELRGGRYSEARNVLVQWKNQWGQLIWSLCGGRSLLEVLLYLILTPAHIL